jgi:type I restriction enzyme S subunit
MDSELPEGWQRVKLGTIMKLVRNTFKPNKEDVRPYIGLEHIKEGELRLESHGLSNEVESNKYVFKKGDILFGKLRPYFRKVIFAKFDGICSTDIWVIRAKNGVDGKFLFYRLASWEIVNACSQASDGTKMPRAQWDYLVNYEVPLPPLPEQRKIAEILGALDDKIELNYEMNKTLEAIAQAIFKHWFVDFEPFKDNPVYNEELGKEIPEGWEVVKLEEIIQFDPPFRLKKGEKYPFVAMEDVDYFYMACNYRYKEYNGSGSKFTYGDTLLARITPSLENGKTAFVGFLDDGKFGFGSTEFIVLHPKDKNAREFVYLLSRDNEFRDYAIKSMTGSSGRQRVQKEALKSYKIAYPPNILIEKFHELIYPIFRLIYQNHLESKILAQIRDALLPKLLSGEIRVKVEEEFGEEVEELEKINKEKIQIQKTLDDILGDAE